MFCVSDIWRDRDDQADDQRWMIKDDDEPSSPFEKVVPYFNIQALLTHF